MSLHSRKRVAMVAIVKWFFFMKALFWLNTCSLPVLYEGVMWIDEHEGIYFLYIQNVTDAVAHSMGVVRLLA